MLFLSLALQGALATAGSPVVDAETADRTRIVTHLREVEARLRSVDTSHLPPELARARAQNLDRLHQYWQEGEFPRNRDFMGERVPYFIDEDDRLCAVGYLVVESGFEDVAREIQATQNNAKLLAMTHPALPEWIAASGLTAQECAQIQPSYCGCSEEWAPVCGADGKTYQNACYAETCAGVEIVDEGMCEAGTDTGDGWPPAGSSTGGPDSSGGSASTGDTGADDAAEPEPESEESKEGCSVGGRRDMSALVSLAVLFVAGFRRRT